MWSPEVVLACRSSGGDEHGRAEVLAIDLDARLGEYELPHGVGMHADRGAPVCGIHADTARAVEVQARDTFKPGGIGRCQRGRVPHSSDGSALGLAALLLVAGFGHFAAPRYVQSLVPPWWPRPAATVAVSGVVELLVAGMIARAGTRSRAAGAAGVLLSVYSLVHLDAARRTHRAARLLDRPTGVVVRIAVNVGYVVWAVRVARAG